MKINIDSFNERPSYSKEKCKNLRSTLCFLSLCRLLALLSTAVVILCILLLCKAYIKFVLIWLEKQDSIVISATICFLFILVSLPISIGYIVLVVATGYLFGFMKGVLLVIFGANIGIFVAHNVLRLIGHHPSIYRYTQSEMANAIMSVICGPLSFKIVFCARLTPIPFGLQNTIFALSSVTGKIYHVASMLGLLPAQFVGVYAGTTLRSMKDVFENNHISSMAYVFASLQLLLGASLMIWLGARARTELIKALAAADNSSTKVTPYSLV